MKVVSAVVQALTWVVVVAIVLLLLLVAPLVAGYHPIVVLSGSMRPSYPVGSVTYYKAAAYEDIVVGDAITFRIGDSSELVTHRVTTKDDAAQSFTTKGDNNDAEDANPLSYTQVVGKTTNFSIPYAGYFVSYTRHWYVLGACGLILVLDMLLTPSEKPKIVDRVSPDQPQEENEEEQSGTTK